LVAVTFMGSACSEAPNGRVLNGDVGGSSGSTSARGGTGTGATGGTGVSANGGTGVSANGGTGVSANGGTGVSANGGTGVSANGGTGMTSGAMGGTTGNVGGTGGDAGLGGTGGIPPTDDPSCADFPEQNQRASYIQENHPDEVSRLGNMVLADKIAMLSGTTTAACNWQCFDAFGVANANIPDFKMRDGPRGIRGNAAAYDGSTKTTAFAVAEARAASFDLALEYRVGVAMAEEMRGLRRDVLLAPTVNTLRHPRWARAQETYGEDPVLVGEMGAAYVKGMQDGPQGVPACPKHFVGNDTDENRGGGNETRIVNVKYPDEQTLRENYTRPFEIIVEKADPACIMAAYNKVNGELSTQNKHILVDILRTDWGWKGFTVSDWWATGSGAASPAEGPTILANGLDCEMPTNDSFAGLGSAQAAQIDVAAKRILDVRASFGQLTPAYITAHDQPADTSSIAQHADLARETAEEGAVLLKNDGILPLGKQVGTLGTATLTSIIVLGPDANVPVANTDSGAHGLGDRGSSNNLPPHAVSYTQGLKDLAPQGVTVTSSTNPADAAGKDIVIIPVTMAHEDEGEAYSNGGDRDDMTLSGNHPAHWSQKPAAFINQVVGVNPNVVVLLAVGSAVIDSGGGDAWMEKARAIVQPFYPGQEGGTAVAKLLYGAINFSGKLPFTVGTSEDQYPPFGNSGTELTVEYLHGYRRFEANASVPKWWFGFGMSYTTYEYSAPEILCGAVSTNGRVNAQVTVTNTGMLAGDEVVQAYVSFPNNGKNHPPKELKTFVRVHLEPGQSAKVPIYIPARDLRYWGATDWEFDLGTYKLWVGPSADPAVLKSADFTLN
jgi:beta-glucosidase